jgi:hypothetical protein
MNKAEGSADKPLDNTRLRCALGSPGGFLTVLTKVRLQYAFCCSSYAATLAQWELHFLPLLELVGPCEIAAAVQHIV